MRYIPDDRRYMTHEVRAIDDARFRGEIPKERKIKICFCGKTVTHSDTGMKIADCPRDCEKNR